MSDRPDVGYVTEVVYRGLPELYRDGDAAQADGASNYPLLRYLSRVLDQLTPLAQLVDRLNYVALDERFDQPVGPGFDGIGYFGFSEYGETGADVLGIPPPWQRYGTGTYGVETYGDRDTSDLVDPTRADAAWLPWLAQLIGVNITGLTATDARARMFNPPASWAHGTPPVLRRLAREALDAEGAYVDVRPRFGGPFGIGIITKTAETSLDPDELLDALEVERPAGYVLAHAYLEDL
jgi:hypothetical protein